MKLIRKLARIEAEGELVYGWEPKLTCVTSNGPMLGVVVHGALDDPKLNDQLKELTSRRSGVRWRIVLEPLDEVEL